LAGQINHLKTTRLEIKTAVVMQLIYSCKLQEQFSATFNVKFSLMIISHSERFLATIGLRQVSAPQVRLHCLKKRHPFYTCHNLVRCHPIYPILGRNIPHEICNKHSCTAHRTSFHVFVLYLVKSSNDFYGIQ